jgi:hypothetical protein
MKRENVAKKTERKSKKNSEIMRVNKNYNAKYVLVAKLFELHLIALLMLTSSIVTKKLGTFLIILSLYLLIILLTLLFSKKSAQGTYISFEENKVVYTKKSLFRNTIEEMKYEDIKEILFQYDVGAILKFWQKRMNMGNMVIVPKKGNVLIYGIEIINIAPFDKLMVDIKKNIGDKIV